MGLHRHYFKDTNLQYYYKMCSL